MTCLTKFHSDKLTTIHSGKVRDSIRVDDKTRLIVVTDRISAFNKKIKTPIPNKGAILNGLANFWFEQTSGIIPNHVIRQIDENITLVKEAQPIRIEMVVRGYLAGSMWRSYVAGQRNFCGIHLPDGMGKHQRFPSPIITPTTKDDDDTEISESAIISKKLIDAPTYQKMKNIALRLFLFGSAFLKDKNVVLVDTKYEFGLLDGELILIDEIHTPDSSRFWDKDNYDHSPSEAEQIDKEFVRKWMLANKVDGEVPLSLTDEVIAETSKRYQEIYELVTNKDLTISATPMQERIQANLVKAGLLDTDDQISLN